MCVYTCHTHTRVHGDTGVGVCTHQQLECPGGGGGLALPGGCVGFARRVSWALQGLELDSPVGCFSYPGRGESECFAHPTPNQHQGPHASRPPPPPHHPLQLRRVPVPHSCGRDLHLPRSLLGGRVVRTHLWVRVSRDGAHLWERVTVFGFYLWEMWTRAQVHLWVTFSGLHAWLSQPGTGPCQD